MAAHLDGWGIARVACQPLGVDTALFHPIARDPAWRERHGYSAATRLLVYAGRFAPKSTLMSSSTRCAASARHTRCSRSAPGRRRRPPASASPCCRSSPRRASWRRRWRAPMSSSMPATRRRSACRCSRRWRAARRRSFALPKGWASSSTAPTGSAVEGGSGADFAAAIAALFEGDRDALASRGRGRHRAEAGDWQRVLPGFVAHYLRLIGEPRPPRRRARDDPVRAYPR